MNAPGMSVKEAREALAAEERLGEAREVAAQADRVAAAERSAAAAAKQRAAEVVECESVLAALIKARTALAGFSEEQLGRCGAQGYNTSSGLGPTNLIPASLSRGIAATEARLARLKT